MSITLLTYAFYKSPYSITSFHYFLIYRYPASLFPLGRMYTRFVAYITALNSSLTIHTIVSFSSHRYPLFHFNAACRTGLCTFPTSYTQCFFYYRIAPTMHFNRCQRTSIFAYSAGTHLFLSTLATLFANALIPFQIWYLYYT